MISSSIQNFKNFVIKKAKLLKNRNFAFYTNYRIKYLLNNAPYHPHHLLVQDNALYLLAFLKFNFADRYKVIMGDSGSMVLGFVLCCQFLYFQSFNSALPDEIAIDNSFLYLWQMNFLLILILQHHNYLNYH